MPKHGEFCRTAIAASYLEASRAFYEKEFGWEYKKNAAAGEDNLYREFGSDPKYDIGGMFEMKPEWFGQNSPAPQFNIQAAAADADESASGTIVSPPAGVPNVGSICQTKNPAGAEFFNYA